MCDWCRYRKIRCDREAPCNSCQHSKRECIRTPPEVLLSKLNNKDAENPSTTTTTESTPTTSKAAKRSSPADEQDDQSSSLRAKKVARSNSIAPSSSSHINDEHNNNSNNNNTASTTLSPAMSGSLSLSPPSTMGLSLCGEQLQQPMTILSSGIQGTPSSLQDQEHLERMRRIEMLLSNVIPGAAEFIANGHHHNHQRSSSFSAAPSSGKHGQQQHTMSPISPALTAAGSPLGLTPIQEDSYIERMKRIELLLGSVQDNNCNNNALVTKLSFAVPPTTGADTTGSKSSSNDDAKVRNITHPSTPQFFAIQCESAMCCLSICVYFFPETLPSNLSLCFIILYVSDTLTYPNPFPFLFLLNSSTTKTLYRRNQHQHGKTRRPEPKKSPGTVTGPSSRDLMWPLDSQARSLHQSCPRPLLRLR